MAGRRSTPYDVAVSRVIGIAHLVAGLAMLAVYGAAYYLAMEIPLLTAGSVCVVVFIASALVQIIVRPSGTATVWLFAAFDILVFSFLIWSFGLLYDGLIPAALTSQTYLFLFTLLALNGLHGRARLVMFAGGIAAGARLAMIMTGVMAGGTFTFSYTWAVESKYVMLSGEWETLLAIVLFSATLAWVIRHMKAQSRAPKPVGTEFTIALAPKAVTNKVTDAPTRVLIAEDSAVNMMVLENMFRDGRFDINMNEDGSEAVSSFVKMVEQGTPPDVILLDIEMPEMDGCDAAREIRRLEKESGLPPRPIIAVTALADEASRAASREAGMDDHMVKPVQRAALLEAIAHAMAKRRRA